MKQRPSGRTVLRLGLSLFAQDLQCLPISYHWQISSASPIVMDHRILVLSLLSFGDRKYVIACLHSRIRSATGETLMVCSLHIYFLIEDAE